MNKLLIIGVLVAIFGYFYSSRDGFDPESVRDKRVLVTGSSSGIGEHLAYEYSKLGARLMLTARRAELLEKVARRCRELGAGEVHILPADMALREDRTRLVAATEKALGGLDQLVLNHADISMRQWKSTPKDIDHLYHKLNVNFVSFVDLTSQFLPALTKSSGRVAVVSSIAGKMAVVRAESYAASKHALHGFYSSWRQDLIHQGVDVSFTMCVLGPIATDHVLEMMQQVKELTKGSDHEVTTIAGSATPQDTAVAILRATTTRAREMYYGRLAAIVTYLHKICPNFLENKMSEYFLSMYPDVKDLELN